MEHSKITDAQIMAGYDLNLRVKKAFKDDAKHFLGFLKNVARKYPVTLSYRNTSLGRFYVRLAGTPGAKIDALLQELILNKGLYYYFSSLKSSHRNLVLKEAILPVFQELIESRFRVPYSRFLRRHILGKLPQSSFVPGDLTEISAHAYEILVRKWDVGIVDDWNFVKDSDSLITSFLLRQINHTPGAKSPDFPTLLNKAYLKGIAMDREMRKDFEVVHKARANGLHRLLTSVPHDQLSELAMRIYIYFEYFDEFCYSQLQKTEMLHGKRYKRIRYGYEKWLGSDGSEWAQITKKPCHDCFAIKGQLHSEGCDVERCPRCRGQHLGCGCQLNSDLN